MKKIFLLIALSMIGHSAKSQTPDSWVQKTDFGGSGRYYATAFSIGSKGYIGTGIDQLNGTYFSDFWEYDPTANVWTQKADFGGGPRYAAASFSIGSKGYVGTGADETSSMLNDFWEYDRDANTWVPKADFGGVARSFATGFSIGGSGYLGTGFNFEGGFNHQKDFWQYDPSANTWIQKADFGGDARGNAVGFSIGNLGYLGTGQRLESPYHTKDFWEYDPSTNSWTRKADFGGQRRSNAVAFSIGGKGYLGTGYPGNSDPVYLKDFWEYDPGANTWAEKAPFLGTDRYGATGFSVGGKGYIGTGLDAVFPYYQRDFFEYTPDPSVTTCNIPTSLASGRITPFSANLRWGAVGTVFGYEIKYMPTGSSQSVTTRSTSNRKAVTGLTPDTEYTWTVRSICSRSPTVYSEYSAPATFFTDPARDIDRAK